MTSKKIVDDLQKKYRVAILSRLKKFIKDWTPPIVRSLLVRLLTNRIMHKGNYLSWQDAMENSTGYDSDLILEKVCTALLKVKSGHGVYERDSVLFDEIEYPFPLLAGLLRITTETNGSLNVLDFGGSLGSTYFQCRNFLSVVPKLNWGIVEQEKFVYRGREHFESEQLKFYLSISEYVQAIEPNVILFSGVLQYLQDPFDFIKTAVDTEVEYIIIDRTPFSNASQNCLSVQIIPSEIYDASFPCWIFGEDNFQKSLSNKYQLIANFDALGGTGNVDGGIDYAYKGMIWRRLQ